VAAGWVGADAMNPHRQCLDQREREEWRLVRAGQKTRRWKRCVTRSSIPDPSPARSADRVVFGKVVWGIMLKHHEDQ
jgi:hypothetical protein